MVRFHIEVFHLGTRVKKGLGEQEVEAEETGQAKISGQ